VRVTVTGASAVVAEVTVSAAADLQLAEGGQVWAAIKATEVRLVAL
jgi:molybdopterin-binding protein